MLRNEVRVRWRELTGATKPATLILSGVLIFGAAHLFLWTISRSLKDLVAGPLPPEAVPFAALLVIVLFPFGVTIGINHSVVALFDRGDLDLLMSSPVSSRTVFASRVVAVATGVFVTLGLFTLPVASIGLFLGLPQLLGVIPTLASLATVAASVGMLVTLLLVRLLGARRARTTAQVVAAVTMFLLFVASQLPTILGGGDQLVRLVTPLLALFEPGRLLASNSLVWLPFRSMFLHPLGTLVSLALAALVFWVAVLLLHRAFAYGVGSVESAPARKRRAAGATRFRTSNVLRTLLTKEWKLVRRDPYLISQVVLQVVYFLPAAYLMLFQDLGAIGKPEIGPGLATLAVVVGGVLASSLARIIMVGEEARDLLAASPVAQQTVDRGKMLAVLLPVWALLAPLALWLLSSSPVAGATLLVFAFLSSGGVALLRLWNPVTASRKDLFKRTSLGDPVVAVLEFALPIVLAVTTYLVATGSVWALLPLGLAAGCMAVAHARR